MGTVCRDLTGKNEVLFIYTQRYVPGRAFEAIGSLGGLTLASRVSACGYEGYSFAGITPKVIRLIREHREKLYAVCFYCDFDNRGAIRAILAHFKNESFYKLVGGPHTMHVGPEDFDWFGADAILCGDGEESVIKWLDSHRGEAGELPGTLPQETTQDQKGEYELLSAFSDYPFPDDRRVIGPRTGLFSVISARGCPHRCAFCFEGGNSKKLRPRPAGQVLEEIRYRLEHAPWLNYLFFADDTFTFDIRRLEELCAGLKEIRREHDLVWFCEGHASFFRRYPHALPMMVDAGLVRMQIGMESGCDEVLDMYGKRIRAEDIRYTARLAWEAGLPQLAGNYIIGGAGESEETAEKTRNFVLSLMEEFPGLLDISTTFPIPLSGTLLTGMPRDYGITWLDTSFVTSLEDVAVNRTDFLTADDLCRARALFLHELLLKMKELARDGRIPRDRILRTVELNLRYGITDNWCGYIYKRDPWLMAYAGAILQRGFLPWQEAKAHPESLLIPMAVMPTAEAGGKPLPEEVVRYLLAADGRVLSQIIPQLHLSGEALERVASAADQAFAMVYAVLQ